MAESTYYTAYLMTNNTDLTNRIAASAQQEAAAAGLTDVVPEQWATQHRWEWATESDWIAAVQSAIDTGIADWGRRSGVITDAMILAFVQPAIQAEAAAAP